MSIDIQVRMRVRDVLAYIDQEFDGVEALGSYLDKHPDDTTRILMYEAALRYADTPNKLLTFGRMYIGDTRNVVSAARVEVLEHLMRNPGISVRELARALAKTPATVSEQVRDLAEAGLVLKESHGPGKAVTLRALPREVHIRLTRGQDRAPA